APCCDRGRRNDRGRGAGSRRRGFGGRGLDRRIHAGASGRGGGERVVGPGSGRGTRRGPERTCDRPRERSGVPVPAPGVGGAPGSGGERDHPLGAVLGLSPLSTRTVPNAVPRPFPSRGTAHVLIDFSVGWGTLRE